ncbi:hypothetical protein [Streptomyces sp. MBT27]|uniref:hypothetical protein n=1 Tax=Streptomyces sp. MBT27 TaxID=1488356 RepID=UPI0014247E8C|nr:hypothetical protein [Streptomyces sp. MBT27]
MAEHDADREPQPIDEEAAWAAIVAGYGEEPADPPGTRPFRSVEDLALIEDEPGVGTGAGTGSGGSGDATAAAPEPGPGAEKDTDIAKGLDKGLDKSVGTGPDKPALGSSVVFAPGVGGPRDFTPAEPSDADASDEGHFVPPEPPPLPEADATAKFAWLGVIGGPLLLVLAAIFGWDITWWLTLLGVGGFLGGIATLFARMQPDEEDDDPGRGAVV